IMALEQSAEEILYSLRSMQALPDERLVRLAVNVGEAMEMLIQPFPTTGALIIVKTMNQPFEDFLLDLEWNTEPMKNFPLRLLVIDPISSIGHGASGYDDRSDLRATMVAALENMKSGGTNLLLVAEESGNGRLDPIFEENVADTVIALTIDNQH